MNVGERFAWVRAVIAAQPRPTLAETAVAVVLAEHYNDQRGGAWPAQHRMAELTRMDRRTIRRALAALERRGLVERISGGGPRTSAVFGLIVPPNGAPQRHQVAPHGTISGHQRAPSGGAPKRHEQVSRSEHAGKPYPAAGARSADAARAHGGTSRKQSSRRRKEPAVPVRL